MLVLTGSTQPAMLETFSDRPTLIVHSMGEVVPLLDGDAGAVRFELAL
jgi:hypothetical protein